MSDTTTAVAPVIALRGISKRYGSTYALKNVSFDVRPGEVHALLGENGAGKSTLMKVISGAIQPDEGHIELEGTPQRYESPKDSSDAGIAMVYQEGSLVETMSVAQNLFLGNEKAFNNLSALNIEARHILVSHNFHVAPEAAVGSLGIAQKQMVEIARATHFKAKVIILDEPTASVTPEERLQLFMTMRSLRDQGVGLIFITHMVDEALDEADRITVLRDGEYQGTLEKTAGEFSRDRVVSMMVGRNVEYSRVPPGRDPDATPTLEVDDVTLMPIVRNMSFSAYAGQIVGIYGLVGAGRSEVAQIIGGVTKRRRLRGGKIRLNGREVRFRTPRQARRAGVVYVTEDRKASGFFGHMSIYENIYLGDVCAERRLPFRLRLGRLNALAAEFVKRFDVRTLEPSRARLEELSGGNQQKVVLAKSLTKQPKVAIIDEPTRGVDLGTIPELHSIVRSLADDGVAVVVISSYLPEIRALSDRILVARGGTIVAEFDPDEVDDEGLMFAAVH
ncbi:sugar ABC transporter ATP-binding protein [Microbacterium sp. No. 7]|uniref:sugar ABC transporter ATP-binding protein n=1 Tax=Microbacterium sp. No. 7 TaxID=1714373 RepID=UPI0006CF7BDB|nr:sugar ABC transporter ATP-binding protein [Microbacterium sp. No. 7]ALJ19354.1 ABC transporter ATP-binding protein [Microbacterium sp. No. 7]